MLHSHSGQANMKPSGQAAHAPGSGHPASCFAPAAPPCSPVPQQGVTPRPSLPCSMGPAEHGCAGLAWAWGLPGRLLGGCWEAAWEAAGRRCWEAAGRHRRVPLTTPADSHHRRSVRSGPWGRRRGSCRSLHAQHRAQQWWLHHADGSEHHLACRCASAGPTASITGCSP